MNAVKIAGISLVFIAGLAVLGLVFYSYCCIEGGYRPPNLAEVSTSQLVIRTAQGEFLSKEVEAQPDITAAALGYSAPDFTLTDFDGNVVSLSDFKGRPVLLNFWATWCPPCRKEMPDLQAFHEAYGDQITILGINWNDDLEKATESLDQWEITYSNLIDERGKTFVQYRLTAVPVSFWIDEEGIIRAAWRGAMSQKDMIDGFRWTTDVLDEVSN